MLAGPQMPRGDKPPVEFVVTHQDRLVGDAAKLALRGNLEMIERGHADPDVAVNSSMSAAVLTVRGEGVVGVIVYYRNGDEVFVQLSYVLPRWRRTGAFDYLWSEFCERARNSGAKRVRSIVSVDNNVMRDAAARQGRREIGVLINYDL